MCYHMVHVRCSPSTSSLHHCSKRENPPTPQRCPQKDGGGCLSTGWPGWPQWAPPRVRRAGGLPLGRRGGPHTAPRPAAAIELEAEAALHDPPSHAGVLAPWRWKTSPSYSPKGLFRRWLNPGCYNLYFLRQQNWPKNSDTIKLFI